MKELLDDGFDDENINLLDAVAWWEKKRLLYNGSLFAVELLAMIIYWDGTMALGIGPAIFFTILYNMVANMFYTIGWAVEILFLYYFKIKSLGTGIRLVLYLVGFIFSLLWTWIMYRDALIWY